ncbi:MAG: DUF87 domain-containing protein, partial [Nanoarchaeota archaeon]|nr:DUF87 domain-containing protein [Nanoarchaeota archaeon]
NASTNGSGDYNYNITIPTTDLGPLPLEVSVLSGAIGSNVTTLNVWARTNISYSVVKNYSGSQTNYTIRVNFTRTDTNVLLNGTTNFSLIGITNSSRLCSTDSCVLAWDVPGNLTHGNYTINITSYNESAYYINASIGFDDYLEEKITSGTIDVLNKSIADYVYGSYYPFYLNVTINNTGNASMNNIHAFAPAYASGIQNISEISYCNKTYPNQTCNVSMLVTMKNNLASGNYYITWRANWTDNNGSVAGGANYLQFSGMNVILIGNTVLNITNMTASLSIQHGNSKTFAFQEQSIGTDLLTDINITFLTGNITAGNNLSYSWVSINPNFSVSLAPGASSGDMVVNVSVPFQATPGNYSGVINVSSSNGGEKLLNLSLEVPVNNSWYFTPSANLSYNLSSSLSVAGEIGNFTIVNHGNVNLTFNITYTSSGAKDYTLYPGIFTANLSSPGFIVNPFNISVAKGQNGSLTLYQNGWNQELIDVGIIITFYNESATPTTNTVDSRFSTQEQYPNITTVLFFVNNVLTNNTEQNRNVTIKFRATDDVNLNESSGTINLSWGGGGRTQINASGLLASGEFVSSEGKYLVLNYSANYTPTSTGPYSIIANVYDMTGKLVNSSTYSFTSYATTTMAINKNISSKRITKVDSTTNEIFYVNYSINNTGAVTAYTPFINFTKDSRIIITPSSRSFANLLSGNNNSYEFLVNVSALTFPGQYNITAVLNWTNPDGTYSIDSIVLSVNVSENKSISFIPSSLRADVSLTGRNSTLLIINNTGNANLTAMNINCYTGTLCSGFALVYNESNFAITHNSSRTINISLTSNAGLVAGSYSGYLNISEQNISKTIQIYSDVPEIWTWSVSSLSINSTKSVSSTGNLGTIIINNTGNVDMTFSLNTTNISLIGTNTSSIILTAGTTGSFNVNYTLPEVQGNHYANVTITNANPSASPSQINVSVNISATQLTVNISSPNSSSPKTNVSAGDIIEVLANATFNSVEIVNTNSTWNININSTNCTNLVSVYSNITTLWNITCSAPSMTDGLTYNLSLTLTHNEYGQRNSVSANSVTYRDISKPIFRNIFRNSINKGNLINLSANITDNINISSVIAYISYPNYTIVNATMNLANGFYNYTGLNLTYPGEYSVNYTANDSNNNFNSTTDWFEVYDKYTWNNIMLDYNNVAVPNINISLYRPDSSTSLLSNETDSLGETNLSVNKRNYDIYAQLPSERVIVKNVNFSNITQSNISFNIHKMETEDLLEKVSLYKTFAGIASNSSGLSSNNVTLVFNYTGYSYDSVNQLSIVKCASWNYTSRSCFGSWAVLTQVSRNTSSKQVSANSTGFSAYFLAENKCGNGLCETTYSETTSNCAADCTTGGTTTVNSGGGGGGGGGGVTIADIEKVLRNYVEVNGVRLETTSIYKELFPGESTTFRITLMNTLSTKSTIELISDGDVKQFIFFDNSKIELEPKESRDVLISLIAPKTIESGNYNGNLIIKSGDKEGKTSVGIRVLLPEGKLLDVKIQPLVERVEPGQILRIQTDVFNLGKTKKVDVQFDLQLLDINTGRIITRNEEAFAVETTISTIKEIKIPSNIITGRYMVKAIAYYANVEQSMQASSTAYINIDYPFLTKKLFMLPIWIYLILILISLSGVGYGYYVKYTDYKRKRYKVAVDMGKLPQASSDSGFVGKIAETGMRAFVDLNKLTMHTLIAGATGGGKTIAAQDIIEEALIHNKSVIIFDPTAQWTGFLRKCEEPGMLKRYSFFDMKTKQARAFNGIIKTIRDPYELINLEKYLNKPGDVTIFDISNLTPQEMDLIVASTIEQIFKSNPEESNHLKTLIVYDEVHRLLPKFGGSGKGFIQLERGCREFRKWGIGLLLVSQVLSDFVGEIKANIGTEIQMGTRYEGDLERINMKYGEDVLKSVVKEPVGTGMNVNAEYNLGRPYFVSFRPILHSVKSLTKPELVKYGKYFESIEDMEYQISKLKELKVDVLELELELKLAFAKVKEGQFSLADMYFESLSPKIDEQWKKLGKSAMHLVKKKISKEEILESVSKAKKEREKYIKKNPEKILSLDEEIAEIKKQIKELDKAGKKTSNIKITIENLERRLKPFKGKIGENDAKGVKQEIESIRNDLKKL